MSTITDLHCRVFVIVVLPEHLNKVIPAVNQPVRREEVLVTGEQQHHPAWIKNYIKTHGRRMSIVMLNVRGVLGAGKHGWIPGWMVKNFFSFCSHAPSALRKDPDS